MLARLTRTVLALTFVATASMASASGATDVDCPTLMNLLGTWKIEAKTPVSNSTGESTFALSLGKSAIVEDYYLGDPKSPDTRAHGVWRVGRDCDDVRLWWFDDSSTEPKALVGSDKADVITVSIDDSGKKFTRKFIKENADRYSVEYSLDGKTVMTEVMTRK